MGFFLQRHEEFLERRGIYDNRDIVSGLCRGLKITSKKHHKIFELMYPSIHDDVFHQWWGSGEKHALPGVYTPLRETIVLFCAALNDEL